MTDHDDQAEDFGDLEAVARDLERLLERNRLATARLADRGATVPDAAMLGARLNLLVESAFGPIDYGALDDPERTAPERLTFEHAFQAARHRLLVDATRQVEEMTGGRPDLAVPKQGLILPNN